MCSFQPCACVPLQVILSNARILFVKHRQGYIFPAQVNVSVMDGCFVAAMQKCNTSEEFIWFYSKSFVVSAASEGSLAMLGVRHHCLCVGWPSVCECRLMFPWCVCVTAGGGVGGGGGHGSADEVH